nr:T9SS type A sorting domain-containing protein [Bacteroidota bacterium]
INIPQVGLKKLWIVDKISVNNIYHIKYADLDGLNEISSEIDVKPYIAKNFIYFSLTSNEVIDREPSENWELLFTRYIDFTFDNTGTPVEYLVAGATSNIDQYANKFYPVANDYEDWSAKPFDSLKNVVGYNWKNFSMATFEWVVEDSTAFFIMNDAGDVYKLVFTLWEGSSTGVFAFNKELISLSFIGNDTKKQHFVSIYPNPASEFVNININNEILFDGKIIMTDLSGRIVYNSTISNSVGNTSVAININDFTKGIYFITLQSNDTRETHKLVVQ